MTTMVQHAVIEHNGKWPAPTNSDGFRYGQLGVMILRSEFESEAKRLGYINGYRWGVEYPTNGKRPDLPDDVECEVKDHGIDKWTKSKEAMFWCWSATESFRITDPRYKPADTSYLNQCKYIGVADVDQLKVKCMHLIDDRPVDEASGPLHVSLPCGAVTTDHTIEFVTESPSTDFPFERVNSNWHERGDLPPVGVECLCQAKKDVGRISFCKVKIVGYGKTTVAMESLQNIINAKAGDLFVESFDDLEFRPILTEREKVIEAACKVEIEIGRSLFESLYDAGMLVLPPEKSDTED